MIAARRCHGANRDAPPDALRVRCNCALLGPQDFEGHYARYPAGTGYAPNRDRFRDEDMRVLSLVLYINEEWRAGYRGLLRIYPDESCAVDVLPVGGTVVAFLSADFEHEGLPADRMCWSSAGWFRQRPL